MPRRQWSFLMPAEDHFFVKWFLTYFHVWFTPEGKILFVTTLIGVSMASPGLYISAYLFPCFTLTLLIMAFSLSFFFRPRITLLRQLPSPPSAAEHMVYRVIVKNIGKRPIRNLFISEGVLPFGLYSAFNHEKVLNTINCLQPGENLTIRLAMDCKLRGIYRLPKMLVGSSFPSGILRWPVGLGQKDRLVVYPKFLSQTQFRIPFHRVYQPGGIAVSSNVGDSNEFLNTREFRQGDRLRDIHWPSFARTGKLIVKEYVDEYFVRIGLFLDTEFSQGDKPNAFERRISIAAGIADAIAKKEYIIDLFAAGEELHHFQMGRALAHLENLLELLSCLEGIKNINFKKLQVNLKPYLKNLSSMVILLKDWDKQRAQFCLQLKNLGISQRVIVIRDQPLTRAPDQELIVIPAKGKEEPIR